MRSEAIKNEAEASQPEANEIDFNKVYITWQVNEDKVNADTVKQWQYHCVTKLFVGRMIMVVQGSTPLSKKEESEENKFIPVEIVQLSDL